MKKLLLPLLLAVLSVSLPSFAQTAPRVTKIFSGTNAQMPSPLQPGRLYLATDTNAFWLGMPTGISALLNPPLTASGVTAGTYGSSTQYVGFTVGTDGRITGATIYSLPAIPTVPIVYTCLDTAVPAIALAGSSNVTVTWSGTFADTNYVPVPVITLGSGVSIALTANIVSKTTTTTTFRVTASAALLSSQATITATATHR